jgi:hypothetical protein
MSSVQCALYEPEGLPAIYVRYVVTEDLAETVARGGIPLPAEPADVEVISVTEYLTGKDVSMIGRPPAEVKRFFEGLEQWLRDLEGL